MNRSLSLMNFRAKAILCMTLVAAMHVVVGCGGAPSLMPGSDKSIALTPNNPLTQILAGTPYSNATALEVNAATNQFRVVFPDGEQQITGSISYDGGKAYISRLTVADGTSSATMSFAANQQITGINTSAGPSWQREGAASAKTSLTAADRPNTVESFLGANADLMAAAQEYDSQGSVSTPPGAINDDSSGEQVVKMGTAWGPIGMVFAFLLFVGLSVAATVIFIIELVVVVTTFI